MVMSQDYMYMAHISAARLARASRGRARTFDGRRMGDGQLDGRADIDVLNQSVARRHALQLAAGALRVRTRAAR